MKSNLVLKAFKNVKTPILASHSLDDKDMATKVRIFTDKATGTKIILNASVSPFSPINSGDLESDSSKMSIISSAEMKELAKCGTCKECSTAFRTSPELAKELAKTGFHCTVCGSPVETTVKADSINQEGADNNEGVDNSQVLKVEDSEDAPDADSDTEDSVETAADDGDMGDTDEDEDEDSDSDGDDDFEDDDSDDDVEDDVEFEGDEDNDDGIEEAASDSDEDDADSEEDTSDEDDDATDEADEVSDADDKDAPEKEEAELSQESKDRVASEEKVLKTSSPEKTEESTLDYDVLAGTKLNKDSLELVMSNLDDTKPLYYLMHNRVPVATLNYEFASDNVKSIFQNAEAISNAFAATLGDDEVLTKETKDNFGIKPVEVKVGVDEAVKQNLEASVKSATEKLEKKRSKVAAAFEHSAGIAAVGINKGLFSDVPNPLKATLYDILSDLNVKNPERAIDKAFKKSGEDYLRAVISKALEISKEPLSARNATAKMVEKATFQSIGSVEEAEIEEAADEMADRLEKGSVKVSSTLKKVEVNDDTAEDDAEADDTSVAAVNPGLLNRLRGIVESSKF